jgi:hypothetical protein
LLTHINPLDTTDDPVSIESIRASVAAEVLLAEDGKVIEF